MGDFQLSSSDWQSGSQTGRFADNTNPATEPAGLTLEQFEQWHEEIKQQPAWRAAADREADYRDGNQLDSEVLRKQKAIGMPPAIEPLIGAVIDSVLGMEAQHRTDWRVIPNSDKDGDEVAQAMSFKLNQAERHSKADKACSQAFDGQATVGIGWVEVSRDPNPFNYPYRANVVPRNEIFWDWRGSQDDAAGDHRYRIRRRWMDKEQAKLMFPDKADLIEYASKGWSGYDNTMTMDGGKSTGLAMNGDGEPSAYGAVTTPLAGDPAGTSYPMLAAYQSAERGSSIEESEWRDMTNSRICLFEVWYRVWDRATVMKMPDGRVVEVDGNNDVHRMLLAYGGVQPQSVVISKMHLSMWLGCHKLTDEPTPYKHNKFPYVPFWGKKEDRTGVPYGLVRGMMFMQDNVNATTSKIRWGLSAIRTKRTKGAVEMDDDQIRMEVARPDADILLTKDFTKNQHVFEVERDFQLNEQQYKMLTDSRDGIKRVGGVYDAFMGQGGKDQSGVAVTNLAEQSTQSLADLYDNFRTARSEVGELLLSLLVEDGIGKPETVVIKGGAIKEDKHIALNQPVQDPETGIQYLNNDLERTLLKVDLEEVPNTPSFKAQQLASFSEVFKSAPEQYQAVLFPQLLSLMDVPNKDDAIKAVKSVMNAPTPQEIKKQINEAVQQAQTRWMVDQKNQEIQIKQQELALKQSQAQDKSTQDQATSQQKQDINDATIKNLNANAVKTLTEAQFAAMEAGQVIATIPQVAPIADVVMATAGYQPQTPAGVNPQFPTPQSAAPLPAAPAIGTTPPLNVPSNTHPLFAPNPPSATSPLNGISSPSRLPRMNAKGHRLHMDKHDELMALGGLYKRLYSVQRNLEPVNP